MADVQEFSLNKKTKMIATQVFDQTPYLKDSKSYVPEDQMSGKKYGGSYSVYLPDPGKTRIAKASAGRDGLKAQVDAIQEPEYVIECVAALNDCEIDEWNKLNDIESFKNEIIDRRANSVAQNIEKDAVDSTVFRSCQVAYVGELDLNAIGLGSAGLDNVAVAGKKVTFVNPDTGALLAKKALGLFNHPEIAQKLYDDKYIGRYGSTDVVSEIFMPTVVANSGHTATITLEAVTDATGTIGFKPVKSLASGTATAGDVFKLAGLKIVDLNGIQTNKDYSVVVGPDGSIPEIRIEIEGKSCGNANAWMPTGTTAGSKSLTYGLVNGKTYTVIQTRAKGSVAFDTYKFKEMPGTKMEKARYEGSPIEVQVYEGGNIGDFSSMVRMVVPYAVGLPDPREAVLSYVEAD